MKRNSLSVMLLSLAVVAGAMTITTDAYAQTNTDRLVTIVDTTSETNSILEGLMSTLNSMLADIMAAITGVSTDVGDVGDSVDSAITKIDSLAETTDDIMEEIEHMAHDTDAEVLSAINTVGDKVTQNTATIDDINTQLASIQERLDTIGTSLGVVEDNVSAPAAASAISGELEEERAEGTVYISHYVPFKGKIPHDNLYEYDFEFSCDKPVFIDKVSISDENLGTDSLQIDDNYGDDSARFAGNVRNDFHIITSGVNTPSGDSVAFIHVNGDALIDTMFDIGADDTRHIDRTINFMLYPLDADDALEFETGIELTLLNGTSTSAETDDAALDFDDAYLTDDDTDNNTEMFDVIVNYHTQYDDTTCSFSFQDPKDTDDKKILINAATSGDTFLLDFSEQVSCNNIPTTFDVSAVKVSSAKALDKNKAEATTLKITAGGSSASFDIGLGTDNDSTNLGVTTKDKDVTLSSGLLTIEGKTLDTSALLIELTYETAEGNSCSVVQ